jgi:transcriptional regulator with PAS, ATPase and Fis domain
MNNPSLRATRIDRESCGAECTGTLETRHFVKPLYSPSIVGDGHPGTPWMLRAEGGPIPRLLPGRDSLKELMGPSRQIDRIVQQVTQVAGSSLTALVQGETGTGKELVACAIHDSSPRGRGPFIAVDCGAIPEALIESELFGYEKGAFTGADQRKTGHFRSAHNGTLFLDEIANLPVATQGKLLRALQERVVQPLGGRHPVPVNVRIIATANVSLEQEVRAGRFRQDLYYRLDEFTITLPALRERPEDILHLANRFLAEACVEFGRSIHGISDDAAWLLIRYHWPGNVRQLRSIIRQAALVSSGAAIDREHLIDLSAESVAPARDANSDVAPALGPLRAIAAAAAADAERRAISRALQTERGNKSAVARLLEIDYKTLQIKLKRYGICGPGLEPG